MRGDGVCFWYQATRLARASASCRYRMGHAAELLRGLTTVVDPRPGLRRFRGADVVVVVRPFLDAPAVRLLESLRAQGSKLVADFDDLLFAGPPEEHPLVRSGALDRAAVEARTATYRAGLAHFDAFTVATEPLREALVAARWGARSPAGEAQPETLDAARWGARSAAPERGRDSLGSSDGDDSHVRVVPNGLSPGWVAQGRALYPSWRPGDPKIMRYLPGSPSHDADFAVIAPMLAELLADRAELGLEIVGPLELPASGFPASWLEAGRVRHLERVAYAELPRLLASSWLTLAPLAPSAFTRCKSAIKFLESAAFGAPCVASPIADVVRHEAGGVVLADAPAQWRAAIERLLDDDVRMSVGARSSAYVEEHASAHESVAALEPLLRMLRGGALHDGAPRDGAPRRHAPHDANATGEPQSFAVAREPHVRTAGLATTDTLVVAVHGHHPVLRKAQRALREAWRTTGGTETRVLRRPAMAVASLSSTASAVPLAGPFVEISLGSLMRPAVIVSFGLPFEGNEARAAAELALTTAAWDSLDATEPWRLLSASLERAPRWGGADSSRPWLLVDAAGSWPLADESPGEARDGAAMQLHVLGGRADALAARTRSKRGAGAVFWPRTSKIAAALLGRAACVGDGADALSFDAQRAGIPVRQTAAAHVLDRTEMAHLAPQLAGLVPETLLDEQELWQSVVEAARAVALRGEAPPPLMTPAWISRGRERARLAATERRSRLELITRRYDKLRRDPGRFFADSKWRLVRLVGRWWPER